MGDTQPGWTHFADADWASARDAFAAALERDPGDPQRGPRMLLGDDRLARTLGLLDREPAQLGDPSLSG